MTRAPSLRRELRSRPPPERQSVTSIREDDSIVIRLHGPMDMAACEDLGRQLEEAEAGDARRVLLDLDGLNNLDARTLHLILRAGRRSLQNGDRLRVTRGNGHVAGIFRLTALDQTLHFDE